MLTLDDIWMRLSTEEIGFFTRRRSGRFLRLAGAMRFLPMRMKEGPKELVSLARRVYSYDAGCLGTGKWSNEDAGFRWDPLRVEVARKPEARFSQVHEEAWALVSSASDTGTDVLCRPSLSQRFSPDLSMSA